MIFFLDENFPKQAGNYLESLGHKTIDIRSASKEGSSDKIMFEMAQKNKAIFLTTDRDFFHTIPFLFEFHCGVITIALRQPNRKKLLRKLNGLLKT